MTQASCHDGPPRREQVPERPQLVLAGNPNVGKSVVFGRLTGANVTVSN